MLFVLLMCCAILILNKFLFNELDKFEFITFPYFKKEPSLMRKLLFCTPYFSALSHLGMLRPHAR